MLTTMNDIPANSTSPLPQSYFQESADSIYSLFAAGLMNEPQVACAPGPSAFAYLAPAGTLYPVVTPGASPALDSAALSPAPVSPLAAQVYQVQQAMAQGLTSNDGDLTNAVDQAGQSGSTPGDLSDAAQVFPMAYTTNMQLERVPLAERMRRKGPPRNPDSPGVSWGGAAVNIPGGGCTAGISGWGKLFLLAGALALGAAILNE